MPRARKKTKDNDGNYRPSPSHRRVHSSTSRESERSGNSSSSKLTTDTTPLSSRKVQTSITQYFVPSEKKIGGQTNIGLFFSKDKSDAASTPFSAMEIDASHYPLAPLPPPFIFDDSALLEPPASDLNEPALPTIPTSDHDLINPEFHEGPSLMAASGYNDEIPPELGIKIVNAPWTSKTGDFPENFVAVRKGADAEAECGLEMDKCAQHSNGISTPEEIQADLPTIEQNSEILLPRTSFRASRKITVSPVTSSPSFISSFKAVPSSSKRSPPQPSILAQPINGPVENGYGSLQQPEQARLNTPEKNAAQIASNTSQNDAILTSNAALTLSNDKTTEAVRSSSPDDNFPVRKRPRLNSLDTRIGCILHNDPNCSSEECVDDFFELYDPFDQTGDLLKIAERRESFQNADPLISTRAQPEALNDINRPPLNPQFPTALMTRSHSIRRPYMTKQGREFTKRMGNWPGLQKFDGCYIHIDFTVVEAISVFECLTGEKPALEWESIEDQIGRYARECLHSKERIHSCLPFLPGRTSKDVEKFMDDCKHGSASVCQGLIRVDLSSTIPDRGLIDAWSVSLTSRYRPTIVDSASIRLLRELGTGFASWCGASGPKQALVSRARDNLHAWKVFSGGSSDILDICWSNSGQRFGLSCCTFEDQYNRPGNLMLGSLDSMRVKMLDGHKALRTDLYTQPVLDPYKYFTVPSIKFSHDGSLFFSGSYDETVKVWLGDDGAFLNSINVESGVTQLATSAFHDRILAVGCKSGEVKLIKMDVNGNLLCPPVVFQSSKPNLEASSFAWCNSRRPDWVIAAFDNRLENVNTGNLVIYDAVAEKIAANVLPGSTRQFDLFLNEHSGSMFATAASVGGARSNRKVRSQVRLYYLSSNIGQSVRAFLEFDSEQKDINKVTLSPCETYITASGTDCRTVVWDIRMPNVMLHELCHGAPVIPSISEEDNEENNTGVTVALWGPTTSRFYTGSSDGIVKIWDVSRGEPFVKNFTALSSQIMSGAFSKEYDMLLIGECSGNAHLYSTRGEFGVPPTPFKVDYPDPGDGEAEEEDSGARAAEELIRSGKMMIRDGRAWATGN